MTEWWAFKPVNTAFEKTKKILLEPFNVWTWLRLMIIVFLVGAGTGRLTNQFSNAFNYWPGPSNRYPTGSDISSIMSDTTLVALIAVAILLGIAIALLFAYLRNVFSFVLVRDLASGDVRIIKPMMENLGRGLRLFAFTLLAGIFSIVVVLVLVLPMVLAVLLMLKADTSTAAGILALVVAVGFVMVLFALLIAFLIAMDIFIGFTYDFVVPMVYFKGMGIIESWRWLWASIKKDWAQYGVYVVARWALELGVGILSIFVWLPVFVIFIAILVVGVIIAAMAWKASAILAVLIGLLLIPVAIAFLLAMMAISMPIAVYFRYYSLDVLRRIDPSMVAYSGRFLPPSPPAPPG